VYIQFYGINLSDTAADRIGSDLAVASRRAHSAGAPKRRPPTDRRRLASGDDCPAMTEQQRQQQQIDSRCRM
jgi:hypothetical protein